MLMAVKPRSHQVIHHDAERMGYTNPPLVKAHAVRLKMSFVEDWTPLKAIQALITCKIGKQGNRKMNRELWKPRKEREREREKNFLL